MAFFVSKNELLDRLLGKAGWQEQAGIGHHGMVVKDNAEYGI